MQLSSLTYKWKVFISYSRLDENFVKGLRNELEQRGVPVWWDRIEIREIGTSILGEIQRGIDGSEFFLLVYSPKSLVSEWVKEEIRYAKQKEDKRGSKFVLVAKLEDQPCPVEFEFLEKRLWADFRNSEDFLKSVAALENSIDKNSLLRLRSYLTVLEDSDLPRELGHITTIRPTGRQIYLIHDAVSNYSAQKSIAGILEHLQVTKDIDLILVEGSVGDVSLEHYRRLSTAKGRQEMADKFLRQGIFSGPEYFDVVSDYPLIMRGVDDESMYGAAVEAFARAVDISKASSTQVEQCQRQLAELERSILADRLMPVEQISIDFKSGGKLEETLTNLEELARQQRISLNNAPNLNNYLQSRKLKPQYSLEHVGGEQQLAAQRLRAVASPVEMDDLTILAKAVREKRLDQKYFYLAFKEMATRYHLWEDDLSNFRLHCEYTVLRNSMNARGLLFEIWELSGKLRYAMAKTDFQRKTVHAINLLNTLLKSFSLLLTMPDYRKYCEHADTFDWAIDFLEMASANTSVPTDFGMLRALLGSSRDLMKYYDNVVERAEAIASNVVRTMESNSRAKAALISAGFLAEQIEERLSARGETVIPLVPGITGESDEEQYRFTMLMKYQNGRLLHQKRTE